MRIRRLSTFVIVLLCVLSFASGRVALAQPRAPATPAQQAEARRHFETGKKLFREHSFDAALVEFDAAYQLEGRPSALRNEAECLRELKRFAEAYEALDRLLATHGPQLNNVEKFQYERALGELAQVTATVEVRASEAGANVSINGAPAGITPLQRPIRVSIGVQRVRVEKADFVTFETELTVAGKQAALIDARLTREIKTGHLSIKEKTGQAIQIFVDDQERGPAPWEGDLPPGTHSVQGRGQKLVTPKTTVEIQLGRTLELALEAGAPQEQVQVKTNIGTAQISIDGQVVGRGIWEGMLPIGLHQLHVVANGYESFEAQFDVVEGKSTLEDIALKQVTRAAPVMPHVNVPPEDPYRGVYVRLDLAFLLQPVSEPIGSCAQAVPGCDLSKMPVGGAFNLHIGHSFDWIALDVTIGTNVMNVNRTFAVLVPDGHYASQTTDILSVAGFLGIGPRFQSHGKDLRFTSGATVGMSVRGTQTAYDSRFPVYGMLATMFDVALLIGDTPGAKFMVGMMGLAEFGGTAFDTSSNVDTFHTKTTFAIGPMIGIQGGR